MERVARSDYGSVPQTLRLIGRIERQEERELWAPRGSEKRHEFVEHDRLLACRTRRKSVSRSPNPKRTEALRPVGGTAKTVAWETHDPPHGNRDASRVANSESDALYKPHHR